MSNVDYQSFLNSVSGVTKRCTSVLYLLIIVLLAACSDCGQPSPESMAFPESQLIKTNVTRSNYVVSYDYRLDVFWEEVFQFYDAKINCREGFQDSSRIVCDGKASPTSSYSVYISKSDLEYTEYFVELEWGIGCRTDWR